jgi:hypothetical protein
MTTKLPQEIQTLVDDHQRMTTALDEARRRAIQTEATRIAAEDAHANAVANALVAGKALPQKPAALSAAQANDDSTDAAVLILEERLYKLTGTLHNVMHQHGLELLREEYETAGKQAHQALLQIATGIAALYDAMGPNIAAVHVNGLAMQVPDTIKGRRHLRLHAISESTTVADRRSVSPEQDEGQFIAEARWPTGEDVRAIATSMDNLVMRTVNLDAMDGRA